MQQSRFKAQGFATSYEQLMRLKAPVVVYMKHRKDDHFSVLRGIDATTVWLADPSLGNRTYSKAQFLEMWQTRGDKENSELAGKFLAVLPNKEGIAVGDDFFTKSPHRQSAQATQQLGFSRPLKKSVRVRKMVISGVPHPLPTREKSLVGRSGRLTYGHASFLGTFSTAC